MTLILVCLLLSSKQVETTNNSISYVVSEAPAQNDRAAPEPGQARNDAPVVALFGN